MSAPDYVFQYSKNLKHAEAALAYAKSKIQGAPNANDNRYGGIIGGGVTSQKEKDFYKARKTVQQEVQSLGLKGTQKISVASSFAHLQGVGNCGEQAALAFEYCDFECIRPVDYMNLKNNTHSFVVIGRPSGTDPTDSKTWGDGAVICDPWDYRAYGAEWFEGMMCGVPAFKACTQTYLIARLDHGEFM